MKVSAINFSNYDVSFLNNSERTVNKNRKRKYNAAKYFKEPAAYTSGAILAGIGTIYYIQRGRITPFAKEVAASMSKAYHGKIPASSLSCLMSGDELLKELPKLSKSNYECTPQNMANGVFKVDLHSHSNYSDGEGYVKNILEDAAEYADELYKKTKQKFIFALTDHDTVEGLKEALNIISYNPSRYKNLRFVPGIEVSFAHSAPKSNNECEMSELLVYGVNPYSENITKFLKNIKQKRIDMINIFIADAKKIYPLTNFSFDEFSNCYDFKKYGNLMNIHWRVFHYTQTKHAVTCANSKFHSDINSQYKNIMQDFKGASVDTLKQNGKIPHNINDFHALDKLLKKYAPHFENGKLIASSENTFEEVIDAFKDEKNVFMAFAHPGYFSNHVTNPSESLKYFTQNSQGLIKASESYHQAYRNMDKNIIETLQKQTESLNLLNLGGRDNHGKKLF